MDLKLKTIPIASCLLVLLISTCGQGLARASDVDPTRLPSIWESAVAGSYHVLYQLETKNSDEILTIEEWASYNRQLFRLDLIGSAGRRTYLTNGATGELLRYKPFVCEQIDEHADDLATISQLFLGYRWDGSGEGNSTTAKEGKESRSGISAYGLGPLWARASQDAERVDFNLGEDPEFVHPFKDNFVEYKVKLKPDLIKDQMDYEMRFYFAKGQGARFVDTIDWVAMSDGGPQHGEFSGRHSSELVIEARAKVIQVDFVGRLDESVFDIPVGYGCARRPELELALELDVGQVLLHSGAPNQATLEVITSRPAASGDESSSSHSSPWVNQKFSMRMLRLSKSRMDSAYKTESYYASLMQFRDTTTQSVVSGGKQARLKRIKRVWWAPDSDQGQATVYTIDQASGECQVGHEDVRNQVLLKFGAPLAPRSEMGIEGSLGRPMALSAQQISFLFADNEDYHLIDLGETHGPEATSKRFRNRVYEKRVQNFKLLASDGSVDWLGPVSIVKHISTYSHLLDTASVWGSTPTPGANSTASESSGSNSGPQQLKMSSDFRLRLTIFFYSSDMTRIMYKLVLELLDNHEVSLEYAHEQLDVSSCFAESDKQVVVVKYPLESVELSRELQTKRAAIRGQVFVRLFTHLSSAFSTLQIYKIEPSLDVFNLRLQMSILELPLTHTFELVRGLKLVADDKSADRKQLGPPLVETTASSADSCSAHCEHYNCLRFSYDLASLSCTVELEGERVRAIESSTSELYSYLERREVQALPRDQPDELAGAARGQRTHLSAEAIVEYLGALVDAAQATASEEATEVGASAAEDENVLVLKLDLTPGLIYLNEQDEEERKKRKFVTLVPIALEHELDEMQEYARELAEESGEQQVVVRQSGGRSPRLQFNVLLADRLFEGKLEAKLEGVTYEECEAHCETNDCKSFSYCLRDETCRITWQHNEKFIRASSREAPGPWQCKIYSLDQLSKFENFGPARAPLKSLGSEPALRPADCANSCMDQQSYTCQGFYFCRAPSAVAGSTGHFACYMIDWHVNAMLEHERSTLLAGRNSSTAGGEDHRECSFYSRSYLAQFDKYFGRRLDLDKSDELGVAVRAGSELEFCAKQCVKLNCLGFDACPAGETSSPSVALRGRGAGGQLNCHLALKSIKGSQLRRAPRCSTFVLSDKSHFNSQKVKLIRDFGSSSSKSSSREEALEPDRRASIGRNRQTAAQGAEDEQQPEDINGRELALLENFGKIGQDARGDGSRSQSSRWFAKLFSLSLGLLLGFGFILAWNEAYARGWTDQARALAGNIRARVPL